MLDHLAQAECDLADTQVLVDAWAAKIAELQAARESTAEAREQLRYCMKLEQLFEAHRDRLRGLSELLNVIGSVQPCRDDPSPPHWGAPS